jgi:Domain of unknown function (DUF4249)
MKSVFKFFSAAVCLMALACVEPFDLSFGSQKEILFIEADLNDSDKEQFISIKKNLPASSSIDYLPVENAKVEVIENKTIPYSCIYLTEGKYKLPAGFKVKVGVPYTLKFQFEGKTYESSVETATPVPTIDNVYSVFKEKGIPYLSRNLDGHEIYIDTKDLATPNQNYLWQWRLFEKQSFCMSCEGGRYFTSPEPLGRCVEDANLKRRGVTYDYICKSDCWEIFYNEDINIMSDIYSNGQTIKGRLVAKVPFFQFKGALIEVQQYSVSKFAFDYYNIMINQAQRNGTLADTPPAGLIGNVKNTADKTEPVGGIFMVSSKTTKSFWIERNENYQGISAIGLLKGRQVNPEPSGTDTTRPPYAPCVEDKNRTAIKPAGWLGA